MFNVCSLCKNCPAICISAVNVAWDYVDAFGTEILTLIQILQWNFLTYETMNYNQDFFSHLITIGVISLTELLLFF
jgi:hypothetical protein